MIVQPKSNIDHDANIGFLQKTIFKIDLVLRIGFDSANQSGIDFCKTLIKCFCTQYGSANFQTAHHSIVTDNIEIQDGLFVGRNILKP